MTMDFSSFLLTFLLLLIFPPLPSSASSRCHPKDEKSLLQIKQSFNNHSLFASWDLKSDCCSWDLVECDQKTNIVTGLHVNNNNLTGKIPPEVSHLTHLKNLVFRGLPNLTGEIPPEICNLRSLRYLQLSFSRLSGSIPTCLGQLTRLHILNLSFNNLTGAIPATLSNLTALRYLALRRNRLTGKIPEFQNTSLLHLFLSFNNLSGEIPKSLGALDLRIIDLGWNRLEGDASHLFNRSKLTEVITISHNLLDFDLSEVGFPTRLVSLDISHNMIRGKIPMGIAGAEELEHLDLSFNRLCGEIPRGGKMEQFDYNSFFNNTCLCGVPLGACKSG